jgi:hypothetical protein
MQLRAQLPQRTARTGYQRWLALPVALAAAMVMTGCPGIGAEVKPETIVITGEGVTTEATFWMKGPKEGSPAVTFEVPRQEVVGPNKGFFSMEGLKTCQGLKEVVNAEEIKPCHFEVKAAAGKYTFGIHEAGVETEWRLETDPTLRMITTPLTM